MRGWFSRDYEPVETIEPGGSVSFQVPNAGWFWDIDVEPERPDDAGHALYGPVEVLGARAGQALVARIDEVVPRDWGRTWADGETFTWTLDGDTWRLGPRAVRSAPFLGVIGMPPPEPGEHSTIPPRRWGGNIDCRELVAGTTLYLPIPVDGALLMAGDGHGAQGDGEVSGTAIECPLELVTLTLDVEDRDLRSPIARTPVPGSPSASTRISTPPPSRRRRPCSTSWSATSTCPGRRRSRWRASRSTCASPRS